MFATWGRFVYRRRRWVAIASIAVALVSFGFAARASSVLSTGGWYDPNSESQQVAQRLSDDFGQGGSSLVVLFQAPGRTDAASPGFQAQIADALARVRADSRVASIVGYAQTGSPRFVSIGGDASWVLVNLNLSEDDAIAAVDDLRSEISSPAGMTAQMTGGAALSAATSAQSQKDLARAESISLPIALLILILVFGSLVAAGLPLFVAGLTIPTTLALIWVLAQQMTMSIFVTSVVTMLGLALAIDYSLFMVSRFREELARGATVAEAVERTVATSGKAVAFSGTAVAIGLSGLLLFRAPTLSSMGIGGALIALTSVGFALTFLPAALGLPAPRVERLRVPNPFRRSARSSARSAASASAPGAIVGAAAPADRSGLWERIASAVMARPLVVLLPIVALLLALGVPFLGERQGLPGADLLPASAEARQAWDSIETKFPAGETRPIDLLVAVQGDPLSAANATALADYSASLTGIAGVSRVDGPFSLSSPTGKPLSSAAIAAVVSAPSSSRPAALNAALAASIRGSVVHLQAISPLAGTRSSEATIKAIRGTSPGPGLSVAVGGQDAASLDFLEAQESELPAAVLFILVAMALMLMLQFGSVVLPIKAVVMTLLSLTASFGALVWIFQDGNLSGILGFTSPGVTISIVPVLMFSIIFGLSMDYEVLLLSRIQEAYRKTGDTSRAVAEGLARTGRVITGAAVIMVAVFAAFGMADLIVIKSLGVGMAIAVLLDATIIRALLVPATMRLLGDRAWWAPSRLARLSGRLGFGHVETEYGSETPGLGRTPAGRTRRPIWPGGPKSEPAAG
jgi:putative drug exporter of the RND superfamily